VKRYIPDKAKEAFFGDSNNNGGGAAAATACSASAALRHRAVERFPIVKVFVVTTNPDQERGIGLILKHLPVRIYRLSASDFFGPDRGAYDGMGVDRLAAAYVFHCFLLLLLSVLISSRSTYICT